MKKVCCVKCLFNLFAEFFRFLMLETVDECNANVDFFFSLQDYRGVNGFPTVTYVF